jgi:HEAT repeat protein
VAGLRYERYFVEFYFSLEGWLWVGFESESTGLRIEEVEPILRAMDELVVEQFEMSPSALEETAAVPLDTPFPLAPTPPSTLAGLIQALSDDDPRARTDAAYALEALGADANAAIPALINNLNYEGELRYEGSRIANEIDVRFAAVHALSVIGPPARDAIPELIQLIQHDPSNREDFDSLNKGRELVPLRVAAIRTLVEIGDSSVIPDLIQVLDDIWGQVSEEAAVAIGQLSGNDFSVDMEHESLYSEDGIRIPVLRAREWWEAEGRHQDWETE